jgi:GMP synthase-like glutamine amidotransferase
MNLHYLQHVQFEGLANIEQWAEANGFSISRTRLYADEALPPAASIDWLVVMGGPMNIYEEDLYPWLAREKNFIREAIDSGKVVLGICLGAQLIADVLGGKVYRNEFKEIGWLPVTLVSAADGPSAFGSFPKRFMAFHWHGDTFHLPPGAVRTAESEGCAIQSFEYDKGRVVGLQFHLESSEKSIGLLIEHCADELVDGKYIQKPGEILPKDAYLKEISNTMNLLLSNMKNIAGQPAVF